MGEQYVDFLEREVDRLTNRISIPFAEIEYCLQRMAVTSGVDADKKAWVRRWLREAQPTEADTIAAAQVNAAIANKSSPTMNLCSEQGLVVGGDLPVPTMGDFFGMGEVPDDMPTGADYFGVR